MSFFSRPFDQPARREVQHSVDEELLVFGYSCKLYRNDRNAEMEDSGALLIPWMGDSALMIDRYDIRNRLEDKAQFGIKPILPQRMSVEEENLEKLLDKERYLALDNDILEVELGAEEEGKRMYEGLAEEGTFHAVGFKYGDGREEKEAEDEELVMVDQPQLPKYLPTSSVDLLEEGTQPYTPPKELDLPEGLITPVTQKLHSIIEKTAKFISLQGQQMEIVIKTKQKLNPYFSFLIPEDQLYDYYQWTLQAISTGKYPGIGDANQLPENSDVDRKSKKGEGTEIISQAGQRVARATEDKESDSDSDSDDEGFELHPLLRASLATRKPASTHPVTRVQEEEAPSTTDSISSFVSPVSSKAFRHIALSVNSSSALVSATRSSSGQLQPQGLPGPASQTVSPITTSNSTAAPSPYPVAHSGSAPVYPAYGFPVYDMTVAYYQASHQYMNGPAMPIPGPIPPPPDLQPIVVKTAEYVAKNGESFEKTVLEKHLDDARFEFLSPWHRFHAYYKMKVEETRQRLQQPPFVMPTGHHFIMPSGLQHQQQLQQQQPPSLPMTGPPSDEMEAVSTTAVTTTPSQPENLQKLSTDGAVSFKLASKQPRVLPPRLDLSAGDEEEEEGDAEDAAKEAAGQNGEREPEAKRPRVEPSSQHLDALDDKVQEFLVTVKAMLY